MKKVIVEINGKKHGPLDVQGANWRHVSFAETTVGLKELEAMGAIVTEVREPLVWEGTVMCGWGGGSVWPSDFSDFPEEFRNKRFHAKLTEIVKGAE